MQNSFKIQEEIKRLQKELEIAQRQEDQDRIRSRYPENENVARYLDTYYGKKLEGYALGEYGGSVGGWSAIQNGQYRLNKSGISKKVLKELSKL